MALLIHFLNFFFLSSELLDCFSCSLLQQSFFVLACSFLSRRAVHTPCRMSSLHTYSVFARSTPLQPKTPHAGCLLSQKLNLHTSTIQPFKKSKNPGYSSVTQTVNSCPELTLQHTSQTTDRRRSQQWPQPCPEQGTLPALTHSLYL